MVVLAAASVAVMRVSSSKWLWQFGGSEYLIFWLIVAIVVAMHG